MSAAVQRWGLSDLPATTPLFPLPGALLLPRSRLPLNIFEPRYLAMLDEALKTDQRLIGMIQPHEAREGAQPALRAIGCAGRITSFSETDDGRYLIVLSGLARFRIVEELDGFAPFRQARVDWSDFIGDLAGEDGDPRFDRDAFLALLRRYFDAVGLSSDWDSLHEAGDEMLINALSMMCPFAVEEKQALLEAPTLTERRETLTALMRFAIAAGGDGGASLQ